MPQYNVKINGRTIPVHAKNEGQLAFAVAALKGALNGNINKIEVQDNDNKNDEQVATVNSASFGRPYLW